MAAIRIPTSASQEPNPRPTASRTSEPELPAMRLVLEIPTPTILKVLLTVLGVWLAIKVWPVFVLVLISLMLVATFYPMIRRLQSRLTRNWAITAVVVGMVVAIALLLVIMIPPLVNQARGLTTGLPEYVAEMERMARSAGVPVRLSNLTKDWTARISAVGPEVIGLFTTVLNGITGVLTVAVLTIYLLIDGPRVGASLIRFVPRETRLPLRRMLEEIALEVGAYMRGQLITSALAGLFSYILLWALGVPEPLALGFLMAVADAVPMVGPLIGTVPAVLMALTQGGPTALAVFAGYVIYHQIESHIIVPRIYGSTMKLPASVILIAILIGATLMGILGALLALPVAAAVPVIARFIDEWRDRHHQNSSDPLPLP